MKKIVSIILIAVTVMGLFACNQTDMSSSNNISDILEDLGITTTTIDYDGTTQNKTTRPMDTAEPTTATKYTGTAATTPTVPKEDPDLGVFDDDELTVYNEFFSTENHISLRLDISASELKKIQKDYEKYSSKGSKSPIYRMADLYVTITKPNGTKLEYKIEQVGVRMKGNTSRANFYDSNGMYNLIHFKVSFQETFDDEEYYGSDALTWTDDAARKARKNRTFATLEKIDIRWNKNADATHIREHYAYELYREMGVLAPRTNLASVDIGNDHAGVWLFYEPIDKIFLEKNLSPEALGGDLYKLGWTSEGATFTSFTSYGVEDEDAVKFYVYDLKTNKKTSDHSSLKNLINTLNSSSCNKEKFASVVDVDNFLMFAAVSYFMGNPDDLRNNYNNCYIYFRKDNGKMILIPYDLDRGFGVNKDWNPSGNHMTTDSPFNETAIGNSGSKQKNPLFTKGILNSNFYKNEYVEALKIVGSSDMLKISTFEEHFNIAKSLYSNDVRTSKSYSNAGRGVEFDLNKSDSSNMSFANYITKKTATLSNHISGYTPDVGTGSGSGSGSGSGTTPSVTEWDLYLRGNFDDNNWNNYGGYRLQHVGGGVYSITVTVKKSSGDSGTFKFKIYNEKESGDQAWYNTVDESKINTTFEYQGGNKNVQVALGTYTIYFDTNTKMIYFEKK